MSQLNLFQIPDLCKHDTGFITCACVPQGFICSNCGELIWQYMAAAPDEPEELGYTTANWAWKYKYGKEWTTKQWGIGWRLTQEEDDGGNYDKAYQ